MSDPITQLPTINRSLTHDESELVALAKATKTSPFVKLFESIKWPLVAGALFMILSGEWLTTLLKDNIPYARTSPVSMLVLKAIVLASILFIAQNADLARKTE